ncbi:efflux transporter outer membrane subunit [Sphingomonas xinjiangensis]|uniref:NodT family efflux transporter outer membrane factor (OMF) lipoprotein n=1 Tax=Sphingomonas xinjiangensis TaxID=643568 RepID=A0A840YAM4_9SPHN|nr:efflux transporter outer membrane subunit [Sphingomonas xinjiangensis]MBB5709904.1 NodT family efflux transporter outer membrane factor (OMF) lipoprotein [Sphingomonas xinjiangensis]
MRRFAPLPLLSVALLGACTVGPDYAGPPSVGTAGQPPARFVRGGDSATVAAPAPARWWTALNDPTLDMLETRALAANPSVAVAQARLRQARGALRLERANRLPQAGASGMYVHAELPGVDLGSLTGGSAEGEGTGGGAGGGAAAAEAPDLGSLDFFNAGFDASWEVDLFGGQRRTVEATRANVQAAEANVADAQVTLAADVANAYVALRDRQQRLALSRQSGTLQRQMFELTQQRAAQGTASALEVERLRTQLESTEAEQVPLAAEIEAYLNALAVLTGAEPGALDTVLTTPGRTLLPPAQVAVGDPAALLQQRPDIRAAERQLAAYTARIGVAEASRFPRLSLTGMLGLGGTSPEALVDLDNLAALAMPRLQWSFLDFGRGRGRVEQAQGARDEAEAQYRGAVLRALQDAEDLLSRFGHRRETVASLVRVRASAVKAAGLTQQRYRAGTARLIDALDAERQRVLAEQNLAQATAALTADYVALQKALGLGWEPVPGAPVSAE